jgi:serine/threonine-protein kinase
MQPADPRLLSLRDVLTGQVLRGSGNVAYHLRDRIGEGGQGWVFTANWDEPGGALVIVKVLRPDAVTREALRRFEREAQVLQMLAQSPRPNPHIVRFFDHASAEIRPPGGGEPIVLPFTVLEHVRGPTLEHVLASQKGYGLAIDRVRRITRQVVLALETVHAQKIVHRDLKPSNILLASDAGGGETAKVTDFGLVKLVDVNLQKTTALAGASLGYAPPEQYEQGNQRVSPRTDVFSLAAIVFEMLTGARAFPYRDGENPLLIVTRLLNGPRPSVVKSRAGLPPELQNRPDLVERLEALVVRATSSDPNDRHESVTELWNALEPIFRAATERASFSPSAHGQPVPSTSSPPMPVVVTSPPAAPVAASVSPPRGQRSLESTARQSRDPTSADSALATPAAWKWRVRVPQVRPGAVVSASFAANGEGAIAVGPAGMARWEGSAWTSLALPPAFEARFVRGIKWLVAGDLVLYGARGLAGRIAPSGAYETWNVPDRDVTFLGAHCDENGASTLVGERPARRASARPGQQGATIGAIAQIVDGRLSLLVDAAACQRLRASTRLRSGLLVAVGDWGALVRLELGVAEHVGSICGGHLTSIVALDDGGAITVGAGGHALSLSPRLEAQLEAVQTTRDMLALAVGSGGVAWAGSAQARLLRRTSGSWVRMSGDVGVSASVVSVWAAPRVVRAICDDGSVIEGIVG